MNLHFELCVKVCLPKPAYGFWPIQWPIQATPNGLCRVSVDIRICAFCSPCPDFCFHNIPGDILVTEMSQPQGAAIVTSQLVNHFRIGSIIFFSYTLDVGQKSEEVFSCAMGDRGVASVFYYFFSISEGWFNGVLYSLFSVENRNKEADFFYLLLKTKQYQGLQGKQYFLVSIF